MNDYRVDEGGGGGGNVMVDVPDDQAVGGTASNEECGAVQDVNVQNIEGGGEMECGLQDS